MAHPLSSAHMRRPAKRALSQMMITHVKLPRGSDVMKQPPPARVLLSACYLGALFPDLVDLGPAIVNKRLGWSLPVVKIFPWHWPRYSGSVYDGSRRAESLVYHLLVGGGSLFLLYANRWRLLRRDGRVHSGCPPIPGGRRGNN